MTRTGMCLALNLAVMGSAVLAEDASVFRIGVRDDAPPFIFAREDGGYGGFLYDMCFSAAKFAGIEDDAIRLVPVTAGTRFQRLDDPDGALDLLCDPTTITVERASRWDFTPIVFFANSAVLRRNRPVSVAPADAPAGCVTRDARTVLLVGWVENTTARPVVEAMGDAPQGNRAFCARSYERHDDGIRDICSDSGQLSFYAGDADILSAQVDRMRRQGLPCRVTFQARTDQAQPYALIVGDRLPTLHRRLIAGFYDFFRRGAADRSFAENFGGRRKSPMLQVLFDLNSIPGEQEPRAGE